MMDANLDKPKVDFKNRIIWILVVTIFWYVFVFSFIGDIVCLILAAKKGRLHELTQKQVTPSKDPQGTQPAYEYKELKRDLRCTGVDL